MCWLMCGPQGGLHSLKAGEEPESLKARRAAAKAQSNSGSSIFRSFTSVSEEGRVDVCGQ